MEKYLVPIVIGYDLGEQDCSRVGYVIPEHEGCTYGSGRVIVRENQLDISNSRESVWHCDCGLSFYIDFTLNSSQDL